MGEMADDYDGSGLSDDDIKEEYQNHIEAAFEELLFCEEALSKASTERKKADVLFGNAEAEAEMKVREAWAAIEAIMSETGEYEIMLPAPGGVQYQIGWSVPKQSVKVIDDDAVPDEFCRLKREPDKKKIKEAMDYGTKLNWARLEFGESHLQWKIIKEKKNVK